MQSTTVEDSIIREAFKQDIFDIPGTMSCSVCREYRFSLSVWRDETRDQLRKDEVELERASRKVISTWNCFLSHYNRSHIKLKNVKMISLE